MLFSLVYCRAVQAVVEDGTVQRSAGCKEQGFHEGVQEVLRGLGCVGSFLCSSLHLSLFACLYGRIVPLCKPINTHICVSANKGVQCMKRGVEVMEGRQALM